jgi:malic enzyme
MSRHGKIAVHPLVEVRGHDDLSRVYTPGVGDEVRAIVEDPSKLDELPDGATGCWS